MNKIIESLPKEVIGYSTQNFSMKNDLVHLEKVYKTGVPEGTIFYCARILEVLVSDALGMVGIHHNSNRLHDNLRTLGWYGLMPVTTFYWANELKHLGNDVRHINRQVFSLDRDLAMVFLRTCMKWFFCDFRYGAGLSAFSSDERAFIPDVVIAFHEMTTEFGKVGSENKTADRLLEMSAEKIFWKVPVPSALLSEILLNRGRNDEAHAVVEKGLCTFPGYPRFRQLMGLYRSRVGEYQEAISLLKSYCKWLKSRNWGNDEAVGILAGAYKRCWRKEGNTEYLRKSYDAYRLGWNRSNKLNVYLGINAATTALWLKRLGESGSLAQSVYKLLAKRNRTIVSKTRDRELALSYWDQVTMAEAALLMGKTTEARRIYRWAFEQYQLDKGRVAVSKAQMENILKATGVSCSGDTFLKTA